MGKVRHDALPQKVQNISENLWEQAETVLRMNNNKGKATLRRYKAAEHRFCDFMAERYQTKNLKNVEARHIYAYVTMLTETDHMPKYICTEMSAIRFFHEPLGSKNKLPTNKQLHITNGKVGNDYLICDGHQNSVKIKMASLQNWRTNHGNKFIDLNRTELVESGKKPRIKRPSWHGLRHLYFQENKRRLLQEGRLTKRQIENELSERMGHHRNEVKKFYSDDLEDS